MNLCCDCGWLGTATENRCPQCHSVRIAVLADVSAASPDATCFESYLYHSQLCPRCQRLNAFKKAFEPQSTRCGYCHQELNGRRVESPEIRLKPLLLTLALVVGVCAAVILGRWIQASRRFDRLIAEQAADLVATKAALSAEMAEAESRRIRAESELQAAHESRRQDPQFLSGEKAEARHELEWSRRAAHDPQFALSPMENTLLQMEKLGKDPAITARQALQQVALLAAPPGSAVEVLPNGDGFDVKVAFKLSVVAEREAGSVTEQTTVFTFRNEVRLVSAKLIRNLFDNCGSRGIRSLQVSCNLPTRHSLIPLNATEAEKAELLRQTPWGMSSIYRLAIDGKDARTITALRTASPTDILNRCRVVSDEFLDMTMKSDGSIPGPTQDPDSPLEF